MSQSSSHPTHSSHPSRPSHQAQQQEISAKEQTRAYAPVNEVSHRDIAERAFALFEARGANHGQDVQDWLSARKDLIAEKQLS